MKREGTFVNGRGKAANSPYSRDYRQQDSTYVPGMNDDFLDTNTKMEDDQDISPIVGFLYSISRKGIGEYWPLHLGTNTIGRSDDCDICLKEMSVSDKHASISIKQMKSTHRLIASIRDIGSKNGIYLNDEELDYDNHSCKSNDLILIGHCYKLLLLLVDAEQSGLSIAEDFVPTDSYSESNFSQNYNAYKAPQDRHVETGTVDLSGAQFDAPGNTNFL